MTSSPSLRNAVANAYMPSLAPDAVKPPIQSIPSESLNLRTHDSLVMISVAGSRALPLGKLNEGDMYWERALRSLIRPRGIE